MFDLTNVVASVRVLNPDGSVKEFEAVEGHLPFEPEGINLNLLTPEQIAALPKLEAPDWDGESILVEGKPE